MLNYMISIFKFQDQGIRNLIFAIKKIKLK